MTDNLREALLADILRWSGEVEPVRADEVTVADYMAQTGLQHQACKRALDRLVDEGRLTRREARADNGRRVTAYKQTGDYHGID